MLVVYIKINQFNNLFFKRPKLFKMTTKIETICNTIASIPAGNASALDCANMFLYEIEAMKASGDVYAKKVLENIGDVPDTIKKVVTLFTEHKNSEFARVLTYRPKDFHAPPGKATIPLGELFMDVIVDILMERIHTANWYLYRTKEKKDWDTKKASFNGTTPDGIVEFAEKMFALHTEVFDGFYKKVTSATKKAFETALAEHKKSGTNAKFRVVFRSLKITPAPKPTITSGTTPKKFEKSDKTAKTDTKPKVKIVVQPKNLKGVWKTLFNKTHGIEEESKKPESTDSTESKEVTA